MIRPFISILVHKYIAFELTNNILINIFSTFGEKFSKS